MIRRSGLFVVAVAGMIVFVSGCSLGFPKPATYVTDISATLNGVVFSNEQAGQVRYWFRYGATTAYGSQTPERTLQISAGVPHDGPYPVSEPLGGLQPNTTYHFRLCTAPQGGCGNQDQRFTTGPAGGRSGIAFISDRDGSPEVYVMNADGSNPTRLTDNPPGQNGDSQPAWAPDGRTIAFIRHGDVYVMDVDGGNPTRLTDTTAGEVRPAWSPDGRKIAFVSLRDGNFEIYVMDADGGNETRLTTSPPPTGAHSEWPAWSPDGAKIAFESDREGSPYVYVMDADGSKPTRLGNLPAGNMSGGTYQLSWSPDGTKLALRADRAFENATSSDIYLVTDGGFPTDLTNNPLTGEFEPAWSPNGTKIVFTSIPDLGDSELFLIDANGSNPTRVTHNPAFEYQPAWSPRF